MKMVLKILITLILLTSYCFSSEKIIIQELVAMASSYVKKPIVLDKNLDYSIYIYTQTKLTSNNINLILFEVLKNNGLRLVDKVEYYFLEQIKKEKSIHRNISVKYLKPLDVKSIMDYLKVPYLQIGKNITFSSLNNTFSIVNSLIKKLDIPKRQKKMRITVLETNINKLKEYGAKYNLTDISKNLWNISLGNVNTQLSPTATKSYGIELKALVSDGITKIATNPIITLRDSENTSFNITRTIPVVVGSVSQGLDNDTTVVENTEYKSFGIKINALPIMDINNTDLSLNLKLQDIISNFGNKPETSDKILKQKIIIPDNTVYLLSGFKKTLKVTNDEGIPLLKDIPYLGYLFKWDTKEDIEIVLQILIEIVSDDNFLFDEAD